MIIVTNMFQPPQSLVDAVRQQTLVPFIGAGMSVGAVHGLGSDKQFPDWHGLILRLAKRLELEQKPAAAAMVAAALPDTLAAAQLAVDGLGRPAFLEEMKAAFDRSRPPVGANLSATNAIWRLQSPFVITTNYDRVLEWPWDPTQIQRIYNDDPTYLATLDQQSYPLRRIWHLHGSIERVDTLILTSDQYKKLYPDGDPKRVDYQNAFNRLQNLLTTRSFLFLGFSLTEPVLRRKLQEVLELTVHTAPIKYLLLKAGQADQARQQDFLDRYNVQVVEFADFGEPMTAAIDAIGREAWPNAVSISRAGLTMEMEPLVDDLLKQVVGLSLPPATIARIFNSAKPAAWPHALTSGDGMTLLQEAIVRLGCALAADDGLPPLLVLADRLKNEASEPWISRLQIWIDGSLKHFAPDPDARTRLAQRLATATTPAGPQRAHVLVRIAPDLTAPDEWVVHVWSWSGLLTAECLFGPQGRRFKQGSSGAIVYDLVEELEARDVDPAGTSIAFLVPTLLACEAIHEWRLAASVANDPPIGASYTVTVRPLERLDRTPLVRRRFKKAWDELKKRAAQMLAVLDPTSAQPVAGVPALMLDATGALRRDLALLVETQGVRCVVLREPPCATALGQLSAVLETSAPAILWYRDPTATPAHVEQTMREILAAGSIADLPNRIRDERLEAFRDETGTHRGMHLTLIWDDADYLPPEHDRDARAKVETI